MSQELHMSTKLWLPLEGVTQTFAVLGQRGSGKTYAAGVLAEELLERKQQVVVLDPTSAWWGLRASADGKQPGFPIVVIGGDRGDVPLQSIAGELLANAIVEKGFSAILDLGLLRKGEALRFVADFLETLYRKNREALHLIIDEADSYAPQDVRGDMARTCGAVEDVVKKGRIRGLGCTLITQRPAVLNKNVLTQCESLFCYRMTHPRDINAIKEWVGVHATVEEEAKVIASLPSLRKGEGWFWSPSWQEKLIPFQSREKGTFDSSATPKAGEKRRQPKKLAAIDLAQLTSDITAMAEEVKANDPKVLKARIALLEKELAKIGKDAATGITQQQVQQAVKDAVAANNQHWQTVKEKIDRAWDKFQEGHTALLLALGDLRGPATAHRMPIIQVEPRQMTEVTSKPFLGMPMGHPPPRTSFYGTDPGAVTAKMPREFLTALAQHPDGLDKSRILALTGYSASGPVSKTFADFVSQGWVTSPRSHFLQITQEGLKALGRYEPLPSGAKLRELRIQHWTLSPFGRKALAMLFEAYPNSLSKAGILQATGYAASGPVSAEFAKLVRLGWVESAGRSELKASDVFFESE